MFAWPVLRYRAGHKICAPVHDVILIEAPLEAIEEVVDETREVMEEASSIIWRN